MYSVPRRRIYGDFVVVNLIFFSRVFALPPRTTHRLPAGGRQPLLRGLRRRVTLKLDSDLARLIRGTWCHPFPRPLLSRTREAIVFDAPAKKSRREQTVFVRFHYQHSVTIIVEKK